jgi:ATP-binding cassette subfamily B protein
VTLGFFNIGGSALVALEADKLSQRRQLGIVAHYFRHVLSLPLSFHSGTHSGRVMKVMGSGAEAVWTRERSSKRRPFSFSTRQPQPSTP